MIDPAGLLYKIIVACVINLTFNESIFLQLLKMVTHIQDQIVKMPGNINMQVDCKSHIKGEPSCCSERGPKRIRSPQRKSLGFKIHSLLSKSFHSEQIYCEEISQPEVRVVVAIPPPNNAKQCKHYVKGCSRMTFTCCGAVDPCHRCHMERGGCESTTPQISKIICNSCDFEQPPGRICVNQKCEIPFSASHCSDCMVWTQSDIHHCHGCGLCRVGKASSSFHCSKCEACFR